MTKRDSGEEAKDVTRILGLQYTFRRQNLLHLVEKLGQRNRSRFLHTEIVAFGGRMRVTMPACAVVVSTVYTGLVKHQRVTQQALTEVGINLDKTLGGDV